MTPLTPLFSIYYTVLMEDGHRCITGSIKDMVNEIMTRLRVTPNAYCFIWKTAGDAIMIYGVPWFQGKTEEAIKFLESGS